MENVKIISGKTSDLKNLENYTREELIEKVKSLEAHNEQLKNVIAKTNVCSKKPNKKQKPFNFEKVHFRHVMLKFLYLGWDYQGFATQEDTTNTIEYHIFEALIKTCLIKSRETSNYHRCGRTDKGVSAFSQVISIDLRSKINPDEANSNKSEESGSESDHSHYSKDEKKELKYCQILNRVLPKNIQCIAWCPAKENYSARFDCESRTYKYYFPLADLEINKMNTALSYLIGTHDFRNFCKMDVANGVVTFIRSISEAKITYCSDTSYCSRSGYDMCELKIKSQGFLWHQIRCIVGVLFLIGKEKESPEVIKELLDIEKNPRKPEYIMASEIPLCLYDCEYKSGGDWFYEFETLYPLITKLQEMWTVENIKTTMIRNMLKDLRDIYHNELECDVMFFNISNSLLPGNKERRYGKYKKLMERQRCVGLEDKIDHFIKKRRIFVKENEEKTE